MTVGHVTIVLAIALVFVPLIRTLRTQVARLTVTERQTKDALRQSDALFRKSPDGLVTVDGEGSIVSVNEKLESMFGYPESELVGEGIEVLMPEQFRSRHREVRSSWTADPQRRPMGADMEFWGQRKDGTESPVACALASCKVNGFVAVATLRDITVDRETRSALAHYADRLE